LRPSNLPPAVLRLILAVAPTRPRAVPISFSTGFPGVQSPDPRHTGAHRGPGRKLIRPDALSADHGERKRNMHFGASAGGVARSRATHPGADSRKDPRAFVCLIAAQSLNPRAHVVTARRHEGTQRALPIVHPWQGRGPQ